MVVAVVFIFAALAACPASAAPVTLIDGNSTFSIDPMDNSGATVWTLDGIDQLYIQQWYYQTATGGVQSINNLGTPVVTSTFGGQGVDIKYSPAGYNVTLGYVLYGGATGSGSSDVSEIFRIQNNGTSALSFKLFEYSDFDLSGYDSRSDDRASHVNANTVTQWDADLRVTESVVRPPDRWQIGYPFAITGDLTNASASFGPADCAWAFQWDLVIPVGGSVVFSKDKAFSPNIPEPMSVMLGVMGLATVSGFRRLRRK